MKIYGSSFLLIKKYLFDEMFLGSSITRKLQPVTSCSRNCIALFRVDDFWPCQTLTTKTEGCDKNSNIVMIAKCHKGDASKKKIENGDVIKKLTMTRLV